MHGKKLGGSPPADIGKKTNLAPHKMSKATVVAPNRVHAKQANREAIKDCYNKNSPLKGMKGQ